METLCFAVKRRSVLGARLDPTHVRYKGEHHYRYPTRSLGSLVSQEPAYGTSARALPRIKDSEPRYIRITDFGEDGISLPHEFKTAEKWASKHVLNAGDLLLARSGATVGKSYLHTALLDPAIYAGYCIRFRFNDEVLPEFVYGFTKTAEYAAWVAAIQRPAGQPNINKEEFKSLEIPVPPLTVQKQLFEHLDAARKERDSLLTQGAELLASINEFVHTQLDLPNITRRDQLSYGIRLSTATESRSLSPNFFHPERMAALRAIQRMPNGRLADLVTFKRDKRPSDSSSLRYVGLASVASGTGQLTDAAETARGDSFIFSEGDVLYGRLRPYLNKVWLADFSGTCSTEFHVMQPKDPTLIRPEYLAVMMRTDLVVQQTKHMMTGNTHPRIANRDVKNLLIPLVDRNTQNILVDEILQRQSDVICLHESANATWRTALDRFSDQLTREMAQ